MRLGRVLVAGGVVTLAMMLGGGPMRLSGLLVVLGGFRMGLLGHVRLYQNSTDVPAPIDALPDRCLADGIVNVHATIGACHEGTLVLQTVFEMTQL